MCVQYRRPDKLLEQVRRYSVHAGGCHSIQLENNRRWYMDEQTLVMEPVGFERLQGDLRGMVEMLLGVDPR